jgi:hypothetical protein
MSADNWTKCPKCGHDFREDYEIGILDGEFEVIYRGSCGTYREPGCGFKFEFNHKVQP